MTRREWLELAYAQIGDGTHDTEEGKRIRHEAWLTISTEEIHQHELRQDEDTRHWQALTVRRHDEEILAKTDPRDLEILARSKKVTDALRPA